MIKVIVDYDETTGMVYNNGMFVGNLTIGTHHPFKEPIGSNVLELVKQGLTADDLVKLKNMEII